MMHIGWTSTATKQLSKLPRETANRIIDKLEWYAQQNDPLQFAEPLHGKQRGVHRFRIGNYRVIFEAEVRTVTILVLAIRKRDQAYS